MPRAGFCRAILSLLVVTAATAQAAERRIAVLEFRWAGQEDLALLGKLADEARSAAVEIARPNGYLVMTRENTLALLADMGNADTCVEGACEIETARAIGADVVVTGEIVPIKGRLFATLKLHETQKGSLLSTADLEVADELDLVRNMRQAAATLLEKEVGKRRPAPAGLRTRSPGSFDQPGNPQSLPAGPFPSAPAPPAAPSSAPYGIPEPPPVTAWDAACARDLDGLTRLLPLRTVAREEKSRLLREFASTHEARCVAQLAPRLFDADEAFTCGLEGLSSLRPPAEILDGAHAVCLGVRSPLGK